MTLTQIIGLAALGLSGVNALLLLLSFVRQGQWKDDDHAKALIARVGGCEGDIKTLKAQMDNVATKSDVAALKAEVHAVKDRADSIDRGVERIEGFLMREKA